MIPHELWVGRSAGCHCDLPQRSVCFPVKTTNLLIPHAHIRHAKTGVDPIMPLFDTIPIFHATGGRYTWHVNACLVTLCPFMTFLSQRRKFPPPLGRQCYGGVQWDRSSSCCCCWCVCVCVRVFVGVRLVEYPLQTTVEYEEVTCAFKRQAATHIMQTTKRQSAENKRVGGGQRCFRKGGHFRRDET